MRKLISQSIRGRTLTIILLTTLVALVVSAVSLLVYEARAYRQFLITDLTTQANILARNSGPALAFDDAEAARVNLQLLTNRAGIVAGAVYRKDGELFAFYKRRDADVRFPRLAGASGTELVGSDMVLVHPVVENGEQLGSIFLQAEFRLAERIKDYLFLLAGAMTISLLVAVAVSLWLQGSLTSPLLAIKRVAQQVVRERNFLLRAPRTTNDEIGELADAFNVMLEEVSERQHELESSYRRLQQESEERRNAEDALRIADARKDEFLATLAHELRNPLAPMVNATTILRMRKAPPDAADEALSILDRQLAQMSRLVGDLLDVSRISRGKLDLSKETVALASIVSQSVETVKPLIESKRQQLTVELPERPVFMRADPVRLSQVLSNLLNNSSKYTNEGGRIALVAERVGDSIRVQVTDNGKGISAQALPQLFTMFMQEEHEGFQRHGGGLGVGLALAKSLVELHGGNIRAESHGPGAGSTFTVELPVGMTADAEGSAATLQTSEGGSARYSVLVVDDNVDYVASLEVLLKSMQHEVRTAHDAPEALALLDHFEPDFAFLDIGLPSMNGFELAKRVRQRTGNGVQLIAVSGWGQPDHYRRAMQAGFSRYMVKPVTLQSIRAIFSTLGRDSVSAG
jgi:signal transduction histidine kinase/ActR/RegA family two-component response regulator